MIKKKGFTLIELVSTIAIFLILCSFGIGILKETDRSISIHESNYAVEKFSSFVDECQNYCYENDVRGYLVFLDSKQEILFTNETRKVLTKFTFSNDIKFKFQNTEIDLLIKNDGTLSKGGTISLTSKNFNPKKIIITSVTGVIHES